MSGPVDIAVLIYLPSDVHINTAKTCTMIEHMLMHIYVQQISTITHAWQCFSFWLTYLLIFGGVTITPMSQLP